MTITTIYSDYFATGEGVQQYVVVTNNRRESAIGTFKQLFGAYMFLGAEITEGIPDKVKHLMPESIVRAFEDPKVDTCSQTWTSSFYLNCS